MTVFLQSLGSGVAKAVTKPLVYPMMMKTHGLKLPQRNLMLM